jgi:hypothetical protein
MPGARTMLRNGRSTLRTPGTRSLPAISANHTPLTPTATATNSSVSRLPPASIGRKRSEEGSRPCDRHDSAADPEHEQRPEEHALRRGERGDDETRGGDDRADEHRIARAEPVDDDPGGDQSEAGTQQTGGEDGAELEQAEVEVGPEPRPDRRQPEVHERHGDLCGYRAGEHGTG